MSNVSAKTEHLVRAAVKGILGNPQSWDQEYWVKTPDDCRAVGDPVPVCGTTYCLGGWMMLYDGWKHSSMGHTSHMWTKGDMAVTDPFQGYLNSLFEQYEGMRSSGDTIFDGGIGTLSELIDRITDDLEINFNEDCPCLTENESCILAGCPCGQHVLTPDSAPEWNPESPDHALFKVVEAFVTRAQEDGDRITARQVIGDRILMQAFTEAYTAGHQSLVETVTEKADRRIQEARMGMAASDGTYQILKNENERLRQQVGMLNDQGSVIRKLRGQIDDLKSGVRQDPAVAKIKAKHARAQESIQALTLNVADLTNRLRSASNELMVQKRAVVEIHGKLFGARQDGFVKAVNAWQKALDVIKKEENL
jgi:hypothetical protein